MKSKLFLAALMGVLVYGSSFAQNSTPSPAPPAQAPSKSASNSTAGEPRIAPGSVIPVQLTKTVDAKKAKNGDEVVAKVTQDMKTSTGEVLVPKDTKIIGHVTEAQARHKDEKQSQLTLNFNQAVLKDQQLQVPMSIQAVIGMENSTDNVNASGGGSAPMPSSTGSGATSPMAGRTPAGNASQPEAPPSGPSYAGTPQSQSGKRPPINGQTQGVIGISDLTLAPASNGAQGSVLTSEKNNVKLESGTMLLLKVSQ